MNAPTYAQQIAALRARLAELRAQRVSVIQANPRSAIVLAAHRSATSPLLQNGGAL